MFQAFSRIIREAGKKFVVMDTAPTGHTLLLLDAAGVYHREVARQMDSNVQFLTPMMQLQDPKQTKVLIATLSETTPVLEAANLQNDLRRAGIEPWAWIINNSIAATPVESPLLREEPVGVERLLELAGSHFLRVQKSCSELRFRRMVMVWVSTSYSSPIIFWVSQTFSSA